MSKSWQEWVTENLDRKCDPIGIVEILLKNQFSLSAIQHMMQDSFPEGLDEKSLQVNKIDYLSLAQKPVQALEKAGAEAIKTEKLQLFVLPKFLETVECQEIIKKIDQGLRPSTVTTHVYGYRTSQTCDLALLSDPSIKDLDYKIGQTLGLNLSYSEGIQGQKYSVKQEFKAHWDYFEPGTQDYANFASIKGNRTWTFMVYLNEDLQGGGTHFPFIQKTIHPKIGDAVIWNNLDQYGIPNKNTMHAGLPVESGEKFIITKWFREKGIGSSWSKVLV